MAKSRVPPFKVTEAPAAPNAAVFPAIKVPPPEFRVVPTENVLVPVRFKEPIPDFTIPKPTPLITELIVKSGDADPSATVRVRVELSVIGELIIAVVALEFEVIFPFKVIDPLELEILPPVRSIVFETKGRETLNAPWFNAPGAETLKVPPVVKAMLTPRFVVPPVIERLLKLVKKADGKVLLEVRTSVPIPGVHVLARLILAVIEPVESVPPAAILIVAVAGLGFALPNTTDPEVIEDPEAKVIVPLLVVTPYPPTPSAPVTVTL